MPSEIPTLTEPPGHEAACKSHGKTLILCEDCRSQIDEEARQKQTFIEHTAFDEAKKDVTAMLLNAIEELKLRPEDGGPYYFKFNAHGKQETIAVQPQQMVGVFDAIFRRLGGWVDLERWQRAIAQTSYEEGFNRALGVARRIVENLYEESYIENRTRELVAEHLKEAAK